jgi:hypothetical protein
MSTKSQIKLIHEPFEDCATHVIITLINEHGRNKEVRKLGVVSNHDVFRKIKSEENVNLDNRYVKDFSMARFREWAGLEKDAEVPIKDFTALNTYFDLESSIDFSHAVFEGSASDMSNAIFGDGPVSFYHAKFNVNKVEFNSCHFGSGVTNFQFAEFNTKHVGFHNVVFEDGDVQFISSSFGEAKISFKGANFGDGKVDFHYSSFGNGNLTFDKAIFGGGEVSFKRVDFGDGKVDFKRVHFGNGQIDFSEAEFKSGKTVFRSAVFGNGDVIFDQVVSESDFIFDNAEFGSGKLSFFGARVGKLSFQLCHFNNYVDLRVEKVRKIDLSYTIVRDIIDLMPTEKYPVEMDELTFSGMRNLGNLYVDWRANNVLGLILSQEESTQKQKSEQFLILKETYNATGRYADEDKAYIWYKRFELKADLEHALKKDPKNAIWAYPTAFSKWLLFDKIGLYATEPIRVLFSVSIVYTIFSLLYLILPFFADTYIDTGGGDVLANMNEVAKAFYYSAITFLTIGYGEFYPVGIMRVFASIEGYVGVFLMGYFSVAFVRKVLR